MSLASNLSDLATRLATECKSLRTLINSNAADLSALTTSAKGTLVAAINELQAEINAVSAGSSEINDATTTTSTTWSSTKIDTQIAAAVTALVDGAPGAINTLNELAAALGDDAAFSTSVATALSNRLRFDAAQTLTGPEQTQGQTNLNVYSKTQIGDPATDFVATFNTGLA